MKKIFLVLLLSILFYLPVKAFEEGGKPGVISAKGQAKIDVKPDIATVSIAVETHSRKLRDAINENNSISEKINENIKKSLSIDDIVKTTGFQVRPVYSYNKSSMPANKITGYRVTNRIQVKTPDTAKLGEIIETALNNGANRISGLNYEISDRQEICRVLLEKAAHNAKKEAEILAESLGIKIGGIKKVSSSCNDRSVRPYMAETVTRAEPHSAPPLEPGETTISARVFVDFIIE